jgi:hypothetical protein
MASLKETINSIKKNLSKGDIDIAISDFSELLEKTNDVHPEKKKKISASLLNLSGRLQELNTLNNSGQTDTKEYFLHFSNLLSSTIYLLGEYEDVIEKIESPLDIAIEGLIRIDPEKASKLAVEKLENAQSMKVIGMGRQNFAENTENNHMIDYYKAIENKLAIETKTKNPFYFKRITQHILKDKFKNHLKECFKIIEKPKNSNKYEMVLYGDMKITYTYHIIQA